MHSLEAESLLFLVIRMFPLSAVEEDEKVGVRLLPFGYELAMYLKLLL